MGKEPPQMQIRKLKRQLADSEKELVFFESALGELEQPNA